MSQILSKKKTLLFLFSVIILFFFVLFSFRLNGIRARHHFSDLTERLFQEEVTSSTLTLHYTLCHPETYGILEYPVQYDSSESSQSRAETYLQELSSIDVSRLSDSDQITYDVLTLLLNQSLSGVRFSGYHEPLGATAGIQAQLPVLLCEYRFSSLNDVQIYLKLLASTDQYFQHLLSYERQKAAKGLFMPDSNADSILSQCQAFIQAPPSDNLLVTVFNQKTALMNGLSKEEIQALQEEHLQLVTRHVYPAYRLLINGIKDLKKFCKNQMGLCYLPQGRAYYEYLVQASTGSALSVDSIQNRIQKQLLADASACRTLLQQYPDSASATVPDLPSDPAVILSDLKEKMQSDFPAVPDTSCTLHDVDASLAPYLSPAFYLTAPIDDPNQNVIYINPSAGYEGLDLYTTLAHEGYPGHLYQNFCSSSSLSPLRSLLNFGGYTEGWATYVEMISYHYASMNLDAVSCAAISLAQKQRSMMLGLSSLLDILIHYRGFSRSDTARFLSTLGIRASASDSLYDAVLESPANYLKYYLGCLTFQDLQEYCRQQWPEQFSLSEFHRYVLEIGPCQFPVLEKYLKLCYTRSL